MAFLMFFGFDLLFMGKVILRTSLSLLLRGLGCPKWVCACLRLSASAALAAWVQETERILPPEWTMAELTHEVLFADGAVSPGFMTDAYYDVMVCGPLSWGCEEVLQLIDLINGFQ